MLTPIFGTCMMPLPDRSVEPEHEYPSGEFTESIGTYATFEAACDAARAGLHRAKDTYSYYKESRTDDDESVYSAQSGDEDEDSDEDDSDEDREEEDFCIRTYHDYGKC